MALSTIYGHRRCVIRCDGTTEQVNNPHAGFDAIGKMIGAHMTDSVVLRRGIPQAPREGGYVDVEPLAEPFIMVVDDHGYETRTVDHGQQGTHMGRGGVIEVVPTRALKPVNQLATALYHANCVPGTTHQIVGDVYVAPDSDWGTDE